MKTRTLLLPLLVVVVILAGSELAVRAVASKLEPPLIWMSREAQSQVAAMDALRKNYGGASVVFVGSSMTEAAVDPMLATKLLGVKRPAYNASLGGIDFESMEFWMLHVVLPRLHPRVVVIGVSSREFNENGINQRQFKRSFFSSVAVRRLDGQIGWLGRAGAWVEARSDLFRFRQVLRRPADAHRVLSRKDVSAYGQPLSMAAFQSQPYSVGSFFRRRLVDSVLNDYAVAGPELRALGRLVAGLRARGIPVAMIEMPVTRDVIPLHPHGARDYAAFKRALASLEASQRILAIDMRTPFPDSAEFVDPIHLNAEGGRRFTTMVVRILQRDLLRP